MEVSSSTARALREAMHRLLTGRPERTDGRLANANLAVRVQVVSRTRSGFGSARRPNVFMRRHISGAWAHLRRDNRDPHDGVSDE